MTFIAREAELKTLNDEYNKPYSSFSTVYGRRRIGKTELIDHFIGQQNCVSFSVTGAYEAKLSSHLENFANKLSLSFGGNYYFTNWNEAFNALVKNIKKHPTACGKTIIFIDEMPWLAEMRNNGFKSALSLFWNDFASKRTDIFLIVCGSATSWIIEHVLEDTGALSNRVTCKIHLNAFNLKESKVYLDSLGHKGLSDKAVIDYFMALGGVAHYLKTLDPIKSFVQNMEQVFFSRNGLLRTELNSLFRSLFKKHETHEIIIKHLSETWSGFSLSDLAKKRGLQKGKSLSNALTELEESGFIVKRFKYGQTTRDALYSLCDPFIYFYTKWVSGTSLVSLNQNKGFFSRVFKSQPYRIWCGYAFENICHQHIIEIKEALGIRNVFTTNHYWKTSKTTKKGAQIDILLVRDDDVVDIIECKFYNTEFSIDKSYASNLQNKEIEFVEETGYKGSTRIILMSINGVEKNNYYNDIVTTDFTVDILF
ncbi:MAG: ATP-binding protein [Colwellia sp.]|jgi:Predicted ATPase (AAA+ superfamily)